MSGATDLPEFHQRVDRLSGSQLAALEVVLAALERPVTTSAFEESDLASPTFVDAFAVRLRLHHASSAEPFAKDKFEHATKLALLMDGRDAELAPRGNPGHDLTVGGERWSLKTQADSAIKHDVIHISKFMELGKGKWEDEGDLALLRDRMLLHLGGYERIFTLRCLSASRLIGHANGFEYELVEIPKALLARAQSGIISMRWESSQNPKPGTCVVSEGEDVLFELYFDGVASAEVVYERPADGR